MQETCDLTKGRVAARLMGFFFPMLLTNTLQQAYTFVDTMIVGKGLGDQALGSVGNLSSLMLLITGFLMGITNGFSVNIAQRFGAGDYQMLRKNIAHSIKLCGTSTAALTLISLIFLKPLLISMQTSPSLMRDSLLYGYIFFGGLMVTAAYNLCSCILRALGDSSTPFKAIMISSVINIMLDCLLIFGFRTGVGGAAFATVFSQTVSVLVCCYKLRKNDLLCLGRDDFAKDRSVDQNLMNNGIPAACMNAVTAVGCMVVQGYVNALGAVFTSAYSVCSKVLNLVMLPSLTAGFSLSAFVSQNKGAGSIQRIREGVRAGILIGFVSWLVVGSVMLLIPHQLAGVMLNESETISLTAEFLRICAIPLLLLNLLFVFRSTVQGMGYPLIPMCSGILEMALRIPVIVLMMTNIGFRATAYAEGVAWFGALLLNVVAYIVLIRRTVGIQQSLDAIGEQSAGR
ncbi:MAG: MATE family efflux transporter [Clostridiales bacterium]|nr:MATE family efflux transporter [Clostridiales bacterium]